MKCAMVVLFVLGAGAAMAQEDPAARIRQRIDQEMKDVLETTRKSLRELVLKELASAGIGDRSLGAQVDRFAKSLVDDPLHNRLRGLLLSKDGRELVERFMTEQNLDNVESLVESYFEKQKNGKFRVREEFEEVLEQMLDSVAPAEAPKAAAGPSRLDQLGFKFAALTDDERKALDCVKPYGLKVTQVDKGSPAGKAGLRTGDIIILVDGKAVSPENASKLLDAARAGTIEFSYWRDKDVHKAKVTINDRRPK